MNLISYKCGDIEIIDQTTRPLFEERYAGLGALIGPHFHRRYPPTLPKINDESLFPHIARVKAKGVQDPFSHGIGRYAPWNAEATATKVTATLSSKDSWNGVPLVALEGHHFKMNYTAELTSTALCIEISVVSDNDSLVGIHYYYHLPDGVGTVTSRIQNTYIDNNQKKPLPAAFNMDSQHIVQLPLGTSQEQGYDCTLYPFPNPLESKILLDTKTYQLQTTYSCSSQENSWQLYHPAGASFVCIEPISAQDPRHPNLTVSSLRIALQILQKGDTEAFLRPF